MVRNAVLLIAMAKVIFLLSDLYLLLDSIIQKVGVLHAGGLQEGYLGLLIKTCDLKHAT